MTSIVAMIHRQAAAPPYLRQQAGSNGPLIEKGLSGGMPPVMADRAQRWQYTRHTWQKLNAFLASADAGVMV